jgi:hypothetical protein
LVVARRRKVAEGCFGFVFVEVDLLIYLEVVEE